VTLNFDLRVEAGFFYLGLRPIALMDAIGGKKDEIFKALTPNPLDRDTYIATDRFLVQGEVYEVTFGTDRHGYHHGVLRVLHIQP